MPVAIVLAAAAILGGVIVAAMGRGGELSRERPGLPLQTDFRTWSDVASYEPPPALIGYDARTTQHALSLIARTLAERDAEIEWLRNRIAEHPPVSSDSWAAADVQARASTDSDLGAEPLDVTGQVTGREMTGQAATGPVGLAGESAGDRGSRWFGAPLESADSALESGEAVEAVEVGEAGEGVGAGEAGVAAEVSEAVEAAGAVIAGPAADDAGEIPLGTAANGASAVALASAGGASADAAGADGDSAAGDSADGASAAGDSANGASAAGDSAFSPPEIAGARE